MTTIRAKVTQGGLTKARVTPQQEILVTNYQINTTNITLDDLTNVSVSDAPDGALLTYNSITSNWEAKRIIENPNTEFNGGFF